MRNVSDEICREYQNTHFIFSNFFFENRVVYEIMWQNIVEPVMPQLTRWRMHVCRVVYLEENKILFFMNKVLCFCRDKPGSYLYRGG